MIFHDAAVTVESGGSARTDGADANAVRFANSAVTNNGATATTGFNSDAILQSGTNGTGNIVNDGTITTTGDAATGIHATDPVLVSITGSGALRPPAPAATASWRRAMEPEES